MSAYLYVPFNCREIEAGNCYAVIEGRGSFRKAVTGRHLQEEVVTGRYREEASRERKEKECLGNVLQPARTFPINHMR